MSDFRVTLSNGMLDDGQRELDWNEAERLWSVSERDSSSSPWREHITPSATDLLELTRFFVVDAALPLERVLHMSPGELTQVHQGRRQPPELIAELCTSCGQHWFITKKSGQTWRKYGRTCNYGWLRGELVTKEGTND